MKSILLLILLILSIIPKVGKSQYVFVKDNFKSANIYDSSKKNVIAKIGKNHFYSVDLTSGDWVYISELDGFCRKSKLQVFSELPKYAQKNFINNVLTHFYSVCETGNEPHVDTANGSNDTTYYPNWQDYYDYTFEPILGEFLNYYKKTKDTVTLIRILEAGKCKPDGGFAETLDYLIGQCYDWNKKLLIRQIKNIKDKQKKENAEGLLIGTVFNYYMSKNNGKDSDENYRLALWERENIENELK